MGKMSGGSAQSAEGNRNSSFVIVFSLLVLLIISVLCILSELEGARQNWEQWRLDHYRYEVHFTARMAQDIPGPWQVEIKDDQIVSIEGLGVHTASRDEFARQFLQHLGIASINGFFDHPIASSSSYLVEYDPKWGYPKSAYQYIWIPESDGTGRRRLDMVYLLSIINLQPLP